MKGVLEFRTGEVSKHLELNLNNVKSSVQFVFNVTLQEPSGSGKLGAKSSAKVTVFAEEGKKVWMASIEESYPLFANDKFSFLSFISHSSTRLAEQHHGTRF